MLNKTKNEKSQNEEREKIDEWIKEDTVPGVYHQVERKCLGYINLMQSMFTEEEIIWKLRIKTGLSRKKLKSLYDEVTKQVHK